MNVQIPWTKFLQIYLELATSLPHNTGADYLLWLLSDAWLVSDGHLRESRTVLDSGFHAVDSGLRVLESSIPDSKTQDGRFHKQKFLEFRNLESLVEKMNSH